MKKLFIILSFFMCILITPSFASTAVKAPGFTRCTVNAKSLKIKNFGISYRSAGENIAGNSTAKKAFDAWMNSSGHKANILGNSFTATGIGVVDSPVYGKILTQMFIGK